MAPDANSGYALLFFLIIKFFTISEIVIAPAPAKKNTDTGFNIGVSVIL